MKKLIIGLLSFFLITTVAPTVDAHSGRTDSNGGHNCSQTSINKGLCTGYHYHNGGTTTTPVSPAPITVTPPAQPQLVTAPVYINGVKQYFNQDAYIKNGTTLVPMRPIFEALGATVQYESSTKKVTGTKDGKTITLTVGNQTAYIKSNGVTASVWLMHPAEITNGSTMVPLRFISESLGANVQWDSTTGSVKITK